MRAPTPGEIRTDDLAHCRALIRDGSRSFHAASRLLPGCVRDPALVLYAFCRVADDAVDLSAEKRAAVAALEERLARAYAGRPLDRPVDRAFARMVEETGMPKALPAALVEGLAWDAEGRRYETLSDLRAYSARVASAVGAMMCVLMGAREGDTLARACDLGVAMQLTNIARDVGEDAAAGRLFLPLDWMAEAGLDPDGFLADPRPSEASAWLTRRLLREADRLYRRAEPGIVALPRRCRAGIYAARYIYDGIGARIRAQGHDSISVRAVTTRGDKIARGTLALGAALADSVMPRPATLYAAPLPETAFLVDAAARRDAARPSRADRVFEALATLKAHEEGALTGGT
jgi:phytoene synthase